METKNVILELRTKKGLSQDELAEKVMVTRQAVSRWENGETVPNTETLKLLSKEFNVTINTLLGAPRQLICQCCGMPLEDEIVGHDSDGFLNEVMKRTVETVFAGAVHVSQRGVAVPIIIGSAKDYDQIKIGGHFRQAGSKMPVKDWFRGRIALHGNAGTP